jgi:hypothetical protein
MIAGVLYGGEHTIVAGHVLSAPAIEYPMLSSGFVVHLHT